MGTAAASGKRPAYRSPLPRPRDEPARQNGHATSGHETDLDVYIARLVDAAPPLTSEQRDVLALLLRRPRRR
jgi:hypothetical protein